MSIKEEWVNTLRPKDRPPEDPKWRPMPGDAVFDCAGRPDETHGIIVSLIEEDATNGATRVLVLWSLELSLRARNEREMIENMRRQIQEHEDSEILRIMQETANG